MLIEPNPDFVSAMRARRKAIIVECAVGAKEESAQLSIPAGSEMIASISDNPWQERRMLSNGTKIRSISVRQRPLDAILSDSGVKYIDFISIDVEGYEIEVLRGFDLYHWRPRIVIIEDNSSGRSEEVPIYMEQRGYIRFRSTGCNDWYCATNDALATRLAVARAETIKALKAYKHVSAALVRRILYPVR